jgi:ubiquitin C-terminal hydrolase
MSKSPDVKRRMENEEVSSSEEEDEVSMKDEQENNEEPDENFEYKLVGVVVHMGTADAGHYISYINVSRHSKPEENPDWVKIDNEKWLEFNDSLVKDYKFKNLEEDCFGGAQTSLSSSNDFKNDYSRNAYMLIYEKR